MISLCSCKQLLYTDIYVHKYCYCMRSRTDCDLLCVCITSFTVWKNNNYYLLWSIGNLNLTSIQAFTTKRMRKKLSDSGNREVLNY